MTAKRFWIAFVLIGAAGTLLHFVYDWSGQNPVVGIFSPVNESVWEHLKLLFFPAVTYSAAAYLCRRRYPNDPAAAAAGIFAGMAVIVILFYTYSGILGRLVEWVNIALFFVGVAVFLLARNLIRKNRILTGTAANLAAVALLILTGVLFGFWNIFPPRLGIFIPPAA